MYHYTAFVFRLHKNICSIEKFVFLIACRHLLTELGIPFIKLHHDSYDVYSHMNPELTYPDLATMS